MCIFWTLIICELHFKVQTSFEAQNFVLLLSFSLHLSSPTFKLLSMASYDGELVLDSSSPWSGVSSLSSFSFCCHSSSNKQRNPLMKKIQGLQAQHASQCKSSLYDILGKPLTGLYFCSLEINLQLAWPCFLCHNQLFSLIDSKHDTFSSESSSQSYFVKVAFSLGRE